MYDTTKEETFALVRKWVDRTQQSAREDAVFFVVGNKADLEEAREVETHDGADLAREHGYGFFETSAKTGKNVNTLFEAVAAKAFEVKTAKSGKSTKGAKGGKRNGGGVDSPSRKSENVSLKLNQKRQKRESCKC